MSSSSPPVYHHVDEDEPHSTMYGNMEHSSRTTENDVSASSSPLHPAALLLEEDASGEQNGLSESPVDRRRRQWAVFLFSSCTVLLFADQNLMSPNLSAIAQDFGFNDEERDRKLGGQIALAFFVLGAPASFVVGCLADSHNRTRLFAWTVGIGEGACFLTFFSRTYPQLYVCRAVTGFSIGGALPLIYSILGDLFAADERHSVSAVVGIGTGVGISLGQGIAGFLGPTFGWRLPFLVVSIPALVCAVAVWWTVEDPERGSMEQAVREHVRRNAQDPSSSTTSIEMAPLEPSSGCLSKTTTTTSMDDGDVQQMSTPNFDLRQHWRTFKSLLSTPTIILSLLQGAPGCVPWGIVNTYLNDFLSENRGMTVEFATLTVLVFGLGNFFGLLIGGAGGSYLYRLDPRFPPLLAGCMAIFACFPFWILLNQISASSSAATTGVIAVLAGLASGATGPIVKATVQNVTLPHSRGQAFALFNTFDDFGRGLGPVFVARLIVQMGGRTPAFNVGVLGWMLCGLFNVLMFCTVERDERKVQSTLRANLCREGRESEPPVMNEEETAVVDAEQVIHTAATKRRSIV